MSIENTPRTIEIDFENIKILPLEEIKKAQEISDIQNLSTTQLKSLLESGRKTLTKYPTIHALPYNLLLEETRIGEYKRIIYFPKIYNGLLFNPKISFPEQHKELIFLETLETTKHGLLGAFVIHPDKILLTADSWENNFLNFQGKISLGKQRLVSNRNAGVIENATQLLDGHYFTPNQIVDFCKPGTVSINRERVKKFFDNEIEHNSDCKGLIIIRDSKPIIVDKEGKYLEDY